MRLAVLLVVAVFVAVFAGYVWGANRHKTCISGTSSIGMVTVCRNGDSGTSIGAL